MSELLWVAVPDGLCPDSKASLRVLVVPRLGAGTIADYGLEDWPTTLTGDAVFQLYTRTSAGEGIATHRIEHVARARAEVWTEFFSGDGGLINGWEPKSVPALSVSTTSEDAKRAAASYRTVTRTGAMNDSDIIDGLIRSEIARWAAPVPRNPATDNDPPIPEIPDFHRVVSNLREHPTVLLELGLVFELIVDIADLRIGTPTGDRLLSIRCTDPPFLRTLVRSPWTRYELTDTIFRPAPPKVATSGIRGGILDLSDSTSITDPTAPVNATRWSITCFDIDGAVSGLRQAAHDNAKNPPVHATMPAIRSMGFALLRPGRHDDLERRRQSATAHRAVRSVNETVFSADELVLGYRVDIKREGDAWRSVCERDASYSVNGVPIGGSGVDANPIREEGHVKPFAAVKDADGKLRADEVVLRWDGWSLALPTPNLRSDTTGPVRNTTHSLPFDFQWDFTIPRRRLPALRFADRYQLRIRVADIAGGGLSLDELQGSPVGASKSMSYRRNEPVQPPTLRGPAQFAAGAALDRLVIRSDYNMSVEQIHAVDPEYPLTESRELHAPTVPFTLVEQHRMLDNLTDERSFDLARRALQTDDTSSGLPDPAADGVNAFVSKMDSGLAAPINDDRAWASSWPDPQPKVIELAAHTDSSVPITLHWSATNSLRVTLAKGAQATIEISSTIDGELENHFAFYDFLANPHISPDDTKRGRNPIVTPPRRIHVVHAVKRPLLEPRWNLGQSEIERKYHDTTAVLKPSFNTDGLDTGSTGRLDLAAAWTEFQDVGSKADPGNRPVTVAHVHSESISRVDPLQLVIRHEFGDTKHRIVTYTLNAISRFREYFKAAEPETAFEVSRVQAPVNILSSARPAVPIVLGVVPAFLWQRDRSSADRVEHARLSQRCRVEVARPWYETGEGEQLAVIVAPANTPWTSTGAVVTRMGRDPLFGSPSTATFPTADRFRTSSAIEQLTLPDLGQAVGVVPYRVTPDNDRWYADIEIALPSNDQSYNPFVQLVLARYQRDSLEGLQLSPLVTADSVPLLPHRYVVLERSGPHVHLTVTGTTPNPPNRLEAILEACPGGIDPDALDLIVDEPNADPDVPAWRPVPGQCVVSTVNSTSPPLLLPHKSGRLRVRLREIERLTSVASPDKPIDLTERNVFVDTIIIPAEWHLA